MRAFAPIVAICLTMVVLSSLHGDEPAPLHQQIDNIIADSHIGELAEKTNDYDFLRRVYLNLVGRIPTSDELQEFVNDQATNKRVAAIDQLIQSNDFDEYMVRTLDVMFMERRGGSRITQDEWTKFLTDAVVDHWSFDRIAQELLLADGTGSRRGAVKFLVQRQVEPNAITRDIGRIFFGRDLQCAQCHDHPNIIDYEQSEYYGIYAFVSRSYLFEDPTDNKKSYVGEKADGDTEFQSVFFPEDGSSPAVPNLLGGLTLDIDPGDVEDGYVDEPTNDTRGIPKFSRRTHLARLVTHPLNAQFAQNAVNRFWAHMMGRGLVHPLDFHHSDNPPTHPALLQLLADEFVRMDFDYRQLLREIALSDVYQRSIEFPRNLASLEQLEQQASRWQQELDASEEIASEDSRIFRKQLEQRRVQLVAVDKQIANATKQLKSLQDEEKKKQGGLAAAQKKLKTHQNQLAALKATEASLKKATAAFPKDKSFQSLAAKLPNRIVGLEKSVSAAKEEIKQHQKQVAEQKTRIHNSEIAIVDLRNRRLGVADMVSEARGAVSVFQLRNRKRQSERDELEQRLASLASWRSLFDLRAEQTALIQRCEKLKNANVSLDDEQDGLQSQLVSLAKELGELEVSISTHEQRLEATKSSLKKMREGLSGLQLVVEDLNASEAQADSVGGPDADGEASNGLALSLLQKKQQQLADNVQQLEGKRRERSSTVAKLRTKLSSLYQSDRKMRVRLKAIATERADAKRLAAKLENQIAEIGNNLQMAEAKLRDSKERRYAVRTLSPLTPEQLSGATIAALGLRDRYVIEAKQQQQKELEKRKAEAKDAKKTSDELSAEQKQVELDQFVKNRLDGVTSTYVSMFAAPGGAPQDVFAATADQALFLANDSRVQNWLSPSKGTLLHRLQAAKDNKQVANQLYLAILSRPPSAEEQNEFDEYLNQRPSERNKALREVAWGLLSSLEFRFNH